MTIQPAKLRKFGSILLMIIALSYNAFMAGKDYVTGHYFGVLLFAVLVFWSSYILYRLISRIIPTTVIKMNPETVTEIRLNSDAPTNKILCPVFIITPKAKKQVWCIVDTGFTGWLSIDSSVAKELGLKKVGEADVTSSNSFYKADVHSEEIRIGKSRFSNVTIQSHKYPAPNEYEMGIIGIKLISQGTFSIESKGGKFTYTLRI